ncbi:MAG: lysophospholipid acyltransferase family protein [Sphingomonadales bacterium]
MKKFLFFLYNMYALVTFVVVMLLLFPIFLLVSLAGPVTGGNGAIRLCRWWADAWMALIGIRHRTSFEVPHDRTRPYIFVANHISFIDAVILVKSIRQYFRPLARAESASLPVFGFIYRNACVTVDRSDPDSRAASVARLKSLLRKKISVFVFPEGTFNMGEQPLKSFYDGAFRVALETGTPIKPILFLDGYDRMHYSRLASLTPGRSRAVYLEEISIEGYGVDEVARLRDDVHAIMHQKLIAYGAGWARSSFSS